MKKVLMIICFVTLFAIMGCGSSNHETTNDSTDNTAPTIKPVNPTDGETKVVITQEGMSIAFSKIINSSDFSILTDDSGNIVQRTVDVRNNVTYSWSKYLVPSTKYIATITTAVKDINGNNLANDFIWLFTTSASATDSDNSPDYSMIYIAYITQEEYPDFFTAGVGKGEYIDGTPDYNLIYGLEPVPFFEQETDDPYITYYDHCANEWQLNEAFVTTDGKLGAHGITCPNGCQNGACIP